MLTNTQIKEINSYLEKSENPLFFFDDDPDGLCSYLLLSKHYKKGKGVVVKGKPLLDIEYLRKIDEYNPDLILVLDKPLVSQEFIDSVSIPMLWIDHHEPVKRKGIHYYNPKLIYPNSCTPTTALVYQITKSDLWIATVGSIADWYIPKFVKEFQKKYPRLLKNIDDPSYVIFETKLGELIRVFSYLLKGKTSEVNKHIALLKKIESPEEILYKKTPLGEFLYKRTEKIKKEYNKLLDKAIQHSKKEGRILLFIYPSSKFSFTSELSNELLHKYPEKIIIIGREKDNEIRMSIRSSKTKLPKLIEKSLEGVKGYGGGHPYACGANVSKDDLRTFLDNFKNLLK